MYDRRFDAKVDENQPEIIAALEGVGARVWVIGRPLDLLVIFRGKVDLLEVKTEDGRLNKNQKETMKECAYAGYWPHVVRSVDEALGAIGAI